jgi:CHAT domain-containing protein
VVRKSGPPAWVKLPGSGPEHTWTADDDHLAGRLREAFIVRPGDATPAWREPAAGLYRQRLEPVAKRLGAAGELPPVRHLIVLPSPALAGVPVEALLPEAAAYTVSYAPSATMFAWLQEKQQKDNTAARHKPARLLALGDPAFPPADKSDAPPPPDHGVLITSVTPGAAAARGGLRAGDVLLAYGGKRLAATDDLRPAAGGEPVAAQVWRDGKTLEVKLAAGPLGADFAGQPAPQAIRAQRSAEAFLRAARGDSFTPLPGTRREVEAIARFFRKAETLPGPDAAQPKVEELAAAGRLKDFDVLHLATHGRLDDQVPMRSALVLSQVGLPDPVAQALAGKKVYDGTLTAGEILRTWKLDAELVTLSACQSGLGKYEGGEGYLGFSQALFLAGARSLVLSLWKVDDQATALLMTRFYENLLGARKDLKGPLPKAEALREAKAWLRGLTAEQIDQELARLPQVRGGEREKRSAPVAAHPFDHPYYWSAFILLGDPD